LAATSLVNATWTNERAAKLDNLDATVSSRAATGAAMALTANAVNAAAMGADALAEIAQAVAEFEAAPYEATAKTGTKLIELLTMMRALAGRYSWDGSYFVLYEVDGVTEIARYPVTAYSTRGKPQ